MCKRHCNNEEDNNDDDTGDEDSNNVLISEEEEMVASRILGQRIECDHGQLQWAEQEQLCPLPSCDSCGTWVLQGDLLHFVRWRTHKERLQ